MSLLLTASIVRPEYVGLTNCVPAGGFVPSRGGPGFAAFAGGPEAQAFAAEAAGVVAVLAAVAGAGAGLATVVAGVGAVLAAAVAAALAAVGAVVVFPLFVLAGVFLDVGVRLLLAVLAGRAFCFPATLSYAFSKPLTVVYIGCVKMSLTSPNFALSAPVLVLVCLRRCMKSRSSLIRLAADSISGHRNSALGALNSPIMSLTGRSQAKDTIAAIIWISTIRWTALDLLTTLVFASLAGSSTSYPRPAAVCR